MHDDPAARAAALLKQSEHAGEAGRFAEALDASEAAVSLLRAAAADDATHRLALADALSDLAYDLGRLDRDAEARAAYREVVALYRVLAARDPDDFRPALAEALRDLARALGWPGRVEALAAAAEAVEIYRHLVAQDDDDWASDLADALVWYAHSMHIWSAGRPGEAVELAEEAVTLYRRLAADEPARFTPRLVDALDLLAQNLPPARRALWCEEAVAITRAHAVEGSGDATYIAEKLTGLALAYVAAKRPDDAAAAHAEAVDIVRALAADDSEERLGALAVALDEQADVLREAGRIEEALASVDEAVGIFRGLATADEGWLRDLSIALEYRRDILMQLDRPSAALGPAREAVRVGRRRLEVDESVDFWTHAELHRAEADLAGLLLELGRVEEAAKVADGAIDTLWAEFEANPQYASSWLQGTIDLRARIGGDDGGRGARYAAVMARVGEGGADGDAQ